MKMTKESVINDLFLYFCILTGISGLITIIYTLNLAFKENLWFGWVLLTCIFLIFSIVFKEIHNHLKKKED